MKSEPLITTAIGAFAAAAPVAAPIAFGAESANYGQPGRAAYGGVRAKF